jgi:hypothetical protein
MFGLLGKVVNIYVFLISLAIGTLFVYLSVPTPTIIYVYPTPDNIEKVEYVDKAQNCFQFKASEVNCGTDSKEIPIQSSPVKKDELVM